MIINLLKSAVTTILGRVGTNDPHGSSKCGGLYSINALKKTSTYQLFFLF